MATQAITQKVAGRAVRRATAFVTAVEQEVSGARKRPRRR
jgi:hypothetical protein